VTASRYKNSDPLLTGPEATRVRLHTGDSALTALPVPNQRLRAGLITVGICLAWLLCSFAPITKYLSPSKALIATGIGLLAITLGMLILKRLNQTQRQIHIAWLPLLFLILMAAFTVLYPISLRHTLNKGSDREDALHIELAAVTHHQYPYNVRTFLGNKPTPLPGALWLAFPFYAIGHIAWQNFLWLALFFVFTLQFFRYRATALFFLSLFLLFSPANLGDFTDGGDYLTNFFYVAIALFLFIRSLNRSLYACVPAALFLGLTLSSRIVYAVVLIPLLAIALQRVSRARTALLFVLILATTAAVTLPVFTPHPMTHLLEQLGQSASKLRFIPAVIHPQATLPLLAVLITCACFFVRMDLQRLFLTLSIASFIMLAPFALTFAFHSKNLRYVLSYLSISTIAFSLWALSQYELLSSDRQNSPAQADTRLSALHS
jgi:hypothetical protein